MSQHCVTHAYRGRVFTAVGQEPYTRKTGTVTDLIRWQAACVDCGAPFEIKTPAVGFETSKAFGRCRCDAHKKTWAEVHAGWTARRTEKGTR